MIWENKEATYFYKIGSKTATFDSNTIIGRYLKLRDFLLLLD